MVRRSVAAAVGMVALASSMVLAPPVQAVVNATVISNAQYPLGLDVDAAGNVWIGYADGPEATKGVYVVPAADGFLFNVPVTAGYQSLVFPLTGIQGILMSPAGHLFVATDGGSLYVATETATRVFGVDTAEDTLTPLSTDGTFRSGLAMDSQGNLFSARKFYSGGGVGVMPAVTRMLYGQPVIANTPTTLTPAGLPWGGWEGDLAIDSADNLFVNTWYSSPGRPNGVYVLPKTTTVLYGQAVTANTLARVSSYEFVVDQAAGIDIDSFDNIYVSRYGQRIVMLSPLSRSVMGQTLTANVAATLVGSAANTGQGVAVAPDASSVISGAFSSTRRLVPVPVPTISAVSPDSGLIYGGTVVTITGTGLTGATSVTFGGTSGTGLSVLGDTSLRVTTPARIAGTVNVVVTTPGGSVTATSAFTYMNPPPRIPPGPPEAVRATAVLGGATVEWAAPQDLGTDSLSLYAVRAWPGGPVCQVPASVTSCQVRDLDTTIDYYFTVVAMSGAGWGNASAPSNTIRPLAPKAPSAPLEVRAVAGVGSATVSWTAPADPGTSPVLDYRVESTPAGGSCVSASLSCVVTGLANGTAYTFTVRARNAVGSSEASSPSLAVTPNAPGITISGTRQARTVTVTGSSTGIAPGTPVEIWSRVDGKGSFERSAMAASIGSDGGFTWQRNLRPTRRLEVRAVAGDLASNTIDLQPMRSAQLRYV